MRASFAVPEDVVRLPDGGRVRLAAVVDHGPAGLVLVSDVGGRTLLDRWALVDVLRFSPARGLVLRYRVEETDDGLSGEEGTFTICSFWLVSALVEIGELRRARALCEKLLSFASPLQLYAEEIDATTGRHLGNFPQAFTHLALVNAVVHLIREEQKRSRGLSTAHVVTT